MRNTMKAAAFAAMLAIPGAAFAAQSTAAPAAPKKEMASKPATKSAASPAAKKPAAVAKHTTAGTVKSSSDTSLVITKAGKDQTFVVNSATEKKGTVEAGAKVNVHYTVDGKNWVATAITVAPAMKAASKSKSKK